MERLRRNLSEINGRGYPAYKRIKGTYDFGEFDLNIVHVQGDPFAAPSKIAIRLPIKRLEISLSDVQNHSRRIGMEDGILRTFSKALRSLKKRNRGSGKSGEWGILKAGQEMFPRTASELDEKELILRFTSGLPAQGRRILGFEAQEMFFEELPKIIEQGLLSADRNFWRTHANSYEDQDHLRAYVKEKAWVAFVANKSILPRASGIDDCPLQQDTVPWESPSDWEVEVELPNQGKIKGTALPKGVTLICGGGYHGKSTLLQALSRGVYNHIPGDGRELCVSQYEAVAVRAEDGRSVCNVDISNFIGNLPNGKSTQRFFTDNASGSTSQAANIVEALELKAKILFIDEDTSATNFMVRDRRMQELIHTQSEPIIPFIDRVQELFQLFGVSTVIVVGGAGDYFDVADQVLVMENYFPKVQTQKAKEIAQTHPSLRKEEKRTSLSEFKDRIPLGKGFDPRKGHRAERVKTRETRTISFGTQEIEVSLVPQLIDHAQNRTLGDWLIRCARGLADNQANLLEICTKLENEALSSKLSETTVGNDGDRAFVRRFELAAAINRLRSLKIKD